MGRSDELASEPVERDYRRVAAASEIDVGKMRLVTIDGVDIVVCHIDEGFFAVDGTCSHATARMADRKNKAPILLEVR